MDCVSSIRKVPWSIKILAWKLLIKGSSLIAIKFLALRPIENSFFSFSKAKAKDLKIDFPKSRSNYKLVERNSHSIAFTINWLELIEGFTRSQTLNWPREGESEGVHRSPIDCSNPFLKKKPDFEGLIVRFKKKFSVKAADAFIKNDNMVAVVSSNLGHLVGFYSIEFSLLTF